MVLEADCKIYLHDSKPERSSIITHSGIVQPKFSRVEMWMCRAFWYIKPCQVFTAWLYPSFYTLCELYTFTCIFQNSKVLKHDWREPLALISRSDLPVSSLYRSGKDGEDIGIIFENKHENGLEI